eukprot:11474-Eustigmatos_ZCMA.PRE.1
MASDDDDDEEWEDYGPFCGEEYKSIVEHEEKHEAYPVFQDTRGDNATEPDDATGWSRPMR